MHHPYCSHACRKRHPAPTTAPTHHHPNIFHPDLLAQRLALAECFCACRLYAYAQRIPCGQLCSRSFQLCRRIPLFAGGLHRLMSLLLASCQDLRIVVGQALCKQQGIREALVNTTMTSITDVVL